MVKHHVKKKKGKRANNLAQIRKQQEEQLKEKLNNIDRFAGSSEEEDNVEGEDDYDSGEKGKITVESDNDNDNGSDESEKSEEEEDDDEAAETDGSEDDDEQEEKEKEKESSNNKQCQNKNENKNRNENDKDSDSSSDEDEYADIDDDDKEDGDDSDDEKEKGVTTQRSNDNNYRNEKKAIGMSNAMSRILGMGMLMDPSTSTTKDTNETLPKQTKLSKSHSQTETSHKSAILSKTTTKLQKQQQEEKRSLHLLRQKRKLRRAENLSAMHIPAGTMMGTIPVSPSLSSSTTQPTNGKFSQWEEINMERSYRRIATRGVVALFNAISKHQLTQREQQEQSNNGLKKNKHQDDIQNMTKRSFLDALKQTANLKNPNNSTNGNRANNNTLANGKAGSSMVDDDDQERSSKRNWNALRDDFMMGSKLKDWDKELSDDGTSSSEDENGDRKIMPTDLSDDDDDDKNKKNDNGEMVNEKEEKKVPLHGKRAIANKKKGKGKGKGRIGKKQRVR